MIFSRMFATFLIVLSLGLSACSTTPRPYAFNVFGDSRLPGNMNFSQDQQGPDGPIDQYIRSNFFGKTIADCALSFDANGHLSDLRVPATGTPYKDISFDDNGWP